MAQTADQIAANWASRLAASTQKITDGINGVSVAPGVAAARQKDVWLQNTQAAQAKWARNVASVSLSDWQQMTISKGVPRIASGAQAAQPKFQAFMSKFLPYVQSGKASLPPRGTLDQNINRAVAMMRHNAKFSNASA
ncbi:MAG TPA: hypothetical protein VHT26_07695 [Trebonia sp.]|jgi:hypothetical protein|nr:hypothetical protein [Trebonia sp.]